MMEASIVKKVRRSPMEATVMDEEIWKELPEELLEGFIARLPMATFFRFRSVCRKWCSLLDSPCFLRQLAEAAPQKQPWFLVKDCGLGPEIGSFYDPFGKKWRHSTYVPICLQYRFSAISAGGLVCFLNHKDLSFHVGNPFTLTWKELPWSAATISSLKGYGDASVGMAYNYSFGGCKIVLVDKCGKYEVYDSIKKSTSMGSIPANINLPSFITSSTVSIGNVVYFFCSEPHGIMSYNVVSGAWDQFRIPTPPNSTDLALAECGGRLLLTGLVENKNDATISVRVWGLQTKVMLMWTEVDRMPVPWCSDFCGKDDAYFVCLCNTRLLVMSLRTTRMNRIFTYDVVSREWSKVPRFVPPDPRRHQRSLTGIGFFPCLSASP